MSGKRAKLLRREMLREFALDSVHGQAWRRVKRAWTATPRHERKDFSVRGVFPYE